MGAKMYDNGLRQSAGLPERKDQAPLPIGNPLLDNMRNTIAEIDKTDASCAREIFFVKNAPYSHFICSVTFYITI